MAKQSKTQQHIIADVMHEYKHGQLHSGSGHRVKNPKQAIAIALKEAGASTEESAAENKRNLEHTKKKKRSSSATNQK